MTINDVSAKEFESAFRRFVEGPPTLHKLQDEMTDRTKRDLATTAAVLEGAGAKRGNVVVAMFLMGFDLGLQMASGELDKESEEAATAAKELIKWRGQKDSGQPPEKG